MPTVAEKKQRTAERNRKKRGEPEGARKKGDCTKTATAVAEKRSGAAAAAADAFV